MPSRMPHVRFFFLTVLLAVGLVACGDSSDEAEAIHGTWSAPYGVWTVYETFYPDGTWDVFENEEPPHSWGTYTLEDGVLTVLAADDAWCPGTTAVFEVTFTEDGNEFHRQIVSESCTESGRGRIGVLTKYVP
jgi:hypothetical protein